MILGFTGSRRGLSVAQADILSRLLLKQLPSGLHHGGAIGADAECHRLARKLLPHLLVTIHPCNIASQREPFTREELDGVLVSEEKPPLDRNRDIVAATDWMVACPAEMAEQARGGTWACIRAARRAGKRIVLLFPEGEWRDERP